MWTLIFILGGDVLQEHKEQQEAGFSTRRACNAARELILDRYPATIIVQDCYHPIFSEEHS